MPAGGTTRTSYRTFVPKLFGEWYQVYLFIPHNDLTEHLNTEIKMVIRQANYEEKRNNPRPNGRKKKKNIKGLAYINQTACDSHIYKELYLHC